MTRAELLDELTRSGMIKSPQIKAAFEVIDRADFVPEELRHEAYWNIPLPIGFGQTISQPLTVVFMLELLQPQAGDNVLDIGSGSGWQTALLAYVVSNTPRQHEAGPPSEVLAKKGHVVAVEIVPELADMTAKNVAKYNFIEKGIVETHCFNADNGFPAKAPYDKIIAAAALHDAIPQAWKDQLKVGGRIVTPIASSIWLLTKKSETEFDEEEHPGFAFVPFVK